MTICFKRVALRFGISAVLLLDSASFAQAPGDERWDIRFSLPGTDNSLVSMIYKGTDLYVGGDFSLAGTRNVNHVGKWDGANWSGLGSGIANATNFSIVWALAWKGNELYAGGTFTNAGNILAKGIAKWDGTNWAALPGGFNGYALGFVVSGNDLYVGGIFTLAADTNTYGFAKFDGANWNTFGSTVSGCVGSFCTSAGWPILIDGSDIYVGGGFSSFAGMAANSIVRWDGNRWNPLSSGVSGTNVFVQSIVKYDGRIVVGGDFTTAGDAAATNLATWNGASWSPLGDPNNTVRQLLSDGTSLYAGGLFTQIGGASATRIARWNGINWSPLGTGLDGAAYSMVRSPDGTLLASGLFGRAGGVAAANIARWDGANWSNIETNVGNGMNRTIGFVRAIDISGSDVYAGGVFTSAGGVLANRAAKWNGAGWSALGTGITGPGASQVRAVAHIGADVYFGGTFTNAGSITLSNIAKWNGSAWSALGGTVNSNVAALAVSGGELYVAGAFMMAGGVPVNRVAKWTGSGWLTLGTGMNNNVNALATAANGDVYAGGSFTTAGGLAANRLAKWNNAAGWTALGNGINSGTVSALAISGSNVYVAGNFSLADSLPATNIARWDGVRWWALGTGLKVNSSSAQVTALAVRGNELFAGGSFTNAGGVEVAAIARWDGTNWYSVGSGLSTMPGTPTVNALAVDASSLWVGGNFVRAGNRPSANIGRWLLQPPLIQLTGASLDLGDRFRFTATGLRGLRFRIDSAPALPQWSPVLSADGFADIYEYRTNRATGAAFFRVVAE